MGCAVHWWHEAGEAVIEQTRAGGRGAALGHVDASGLDELTKFMASMPGKNEKARQSGMGHVGYNLKRVTKESVNKNAFGWPGVSALTQTSRAFPSRRYGTREASRNIAMHQSVAKMSDRLWGSLTNLAVYSLEATGELFFGFQAGAFGKKVGYKRIKRDSSGAAMRDSKGRVMKENKMVANVIGESVVDLARALTNGFSYVLQTMAQQRYFAALGFPFKMGTRFTIPARPLVGPAFVAARPMIPTWFREKFWAKLRGSVLGDAERGRVELFGSDRRSTFFIDQRRAA
jgi:hypothetical protein